MECSLHCLGAECYVLTFDGLRFLLDAPLDLTSGEDVGEPVCAMTTAHFEACDLSLIDVILVSNHRMFLGLPYITGYDRC